jgi:hypothetical protein
MKLLFPRHGPFLSLWTSRDDTALRAKILRLTSRTKPARSGALDERKAVADALFAAGWL